MRPGLHRRRALAQMAGDNIRREALRIVAEEGVPIEEATMRVFADQELLSQCHQVSGRPVPAAPRSDVEAQNGG